MRFDESDEKVIHRPPKDSAVSSSSLRVKNLCIMVKIGGSEKRRPKLGKET